MLKKPSPIYSSYSNFHTLSYFQSQPTCASAPQHRRQSPTSSRPQRPHRRSYATTRSGTHQDQSYDLPWPKLPSATSIPTPYQILRTKRGALYSKHRYYELAKIYHPDRHGHGNGQLDTNALSGAVKMERYRLVVSAHEILSDPVRRSAYDATGAGWNGRPEHGTIKYHWGQNKETRWSGFDTNDSPFQNATWEDWEKWYMRDKKKQEPVYFSNGGFLMLVITVVFLGGFGQSIRVGDYSDLFQRQVEKAHDDASKTLRQRKTESIKFDNRDERLRNFLSSRDPHGYGVTDPTEEGYRKLLLEPEVCISDGINIRGKKYGGDHDSFGAASGLDPWWNPAGFGVSYDRLTMFASPAKSSLPCYRPDFLQEELPHFSSRGTSDDRDNDHSLSFMGILLSLRTHCPICRLSKSVATMATQLPHLPDVERISPLIIRILGGNPSIFTLQGTNTYLVGKGTDRILIDTGEGKPSWSRHLSSVLVSQNTSISHALITHWHPDHVGGIKDLRSLCPNVVIHRCTIPERPDPSIQNSIVHRQKFNAEGATLEAFHCPGHTQDHMAIILHEEDAMFTGDNVLGHGTAVFEDLTIYLDSLGRMRDQFTGRAYPGHGAVIENGPARIDEYIAHRQQREQEVLQALDGIDREATPMELVRVVYESVPENLHVPAAGGVVQVLQKLARDGKVVRTGNGNWEMAGKAML